MTSDEKRVALRDRIAKAQQRLTEHPASEQARDTAGALIDYAKRNPALVVGGAAALGLVLGSLSRSGRKAATATGLLGRIATDAAIAFALAMYERAAERARETADDDDTGAKIGDGTRQRAD